MDGLGQQKTPRYRAVGQELRGSVGGSYRDRTDDIHGVNVALYQLS
jgi:hypothetical protein